MLSTLVKNTLKLSSSSVILMFIPIIVTPILARLYTPEDYGIWGIFASVLSIANSFIFLSYENAIARSNEDKEVPYLIILCFIISISITLLITFIFATGKTIGVPFFVNFQSVPLLSTTLFVSAIYNILNSTANREKRYGVMSIANVMFGSSQATIRIFLGTFPIISYGLIVGNIAGLFIATIYIIIPLLSYLKRYSTDRLTVENIKAIAIRYKKFPIYDAPARFVEYLALNLAIIILSNYFGKDEIGYFSMVIQFIYLPISLVGSSMGKVYYREVSENFHDPAALSSITRKVAKITFVLSLLPILFLTFGGDKLLVFILGDQWIPAGSMVLIMAIFSVPIILSQPLLPVFRTLDMQEIRFKLNLLNFILAIGSLILGAIFSDNIYIVLFVYSVSYASVQFVLYFKILRITKLHLYSVSKYFIEIIVVCYLMLLFRIYFLGILF